MLGELSLTKYDNLFGWGSKDDETTSTSSNTTYTDEQLYDMSLEELMEVEVQPDNTSTSTSTTTTQQKSSFDWGQVGNLLGSFAESSNVFGTQQQQQQPTVMYAPQQQQSSNTGLYIGLALAVVVIVIVLVVVMKKK